MAPTDGNPCGQKPCNDIVDRWGEMISRQHAEGIKSIKELLTMQGATLKADIEEIKKSVKDQGDEIFPRLRSVEERITVIEATKITQEKVEKIVAENDVVKWTSRRRSFERALAVPVLAAIIIGVIVWLNTMQVEHKKTPTAEVQQKAGGK